MKFQKGTSGNPSGRPKAAERFRRKAEKQLPKNLRELVAMRDDPDTPKHVKLSVIQELNDRALGKPGTAVENTYSGTITLQVVTGIVRRPSDAIGAKTTPAIIDLPPEPESTEPAT